MDIHFSDTSDIEGITVSLSAGVQHIKVKDSSSGHDPIVDFSRTAPRRRVRKRMRFWWHQHARCGNSGDIDRGGPKLPTSCYGGSYVGIHWGDLVSSDSDKARPSLSYPPCNDECSLTRQSVLCVVAERSR